MKEYIIIRGEAYLNEFDGVIKSIGITEDYTSFFEGTLIDKRSAYSTEITYVLGELKPDMKKGIITMSFTQFYPISNKTKKFVLNSISLEQGDYIGQSDDGVMPRDSRIQIEYLNERSAKPMLKFAWSLNEIKKGIPNFPDEMKAEINKFYDNMDNNLTGTKSPRPTEIQEIKLPEVKKKETSFNVEISHTKTKAKKKKVTSYISPIDEILNS